MGGETGVANGSVVRGMSWLTGIALAPLEESKCEKPVGRLEGMICTRSKIEAYLLGSS
jgi:hypothetical protein